MKGSTSWSFALGHTAWPIACWSTVCCRMRWMPLSANLSSHTTVFLVPSVILHELPAIQGEILSPSWCFNIYWPTCDIPGHPATNRRWLSLAWSAMLVFYLALPRSTFRNSLRPRGKKRLRKVRETNRMVRRLLYVCLGENILDCLLHYNPHDVCVGALSSRVCCRA